MTTLLWYCRLWKRTAGCLILIASFRIFPYRRRLLQKGYIKMLFFKVLLEFASEHIPLMLVKSTVCFQHLFKLGTGTVQPDYDDIETDLPRI